MNSIIANISFAQGELIEDNYILAFKQITEIAVKAMSPGINDPGTAINAIDYLTELFSLRMQKSDQWIFSKNEKELLRISVISFRELIYNIMASLRTYCKHDPIMVQKLFWMLNYLQEQCAMDKNYHLALKEEKETLLEQAKTSLDSKRDFHLIAENQL